MPRERRIGDCFSSSQAPASAQLVGLGSQPNQLFLRPSTLGSALPLYPRWAEDCACTHQLLSLLVRSCQSLREGHSDKG